MKCCINTNYSGSTIDQTQAQIDAHVAAIVAAIPNCTHINVNTYLDYPVIIGRWVNAIRANGKIPWFRTWGYNFWQGKNGVSVDNAEAALATHRTQIQQFITDNASLFQRGDVFSAVPDEPENWAGWNINYTSLGTTPGKNAFNAFVQGSIADCNTAFAAAGISGVDTTYVFSSPWTAANVYNTTSVAMLTAMGTDSYWDGTSSPTTTYPWIAGIVDGHIAAQTTLWGITKYINTSQNGKPQHYTMGVGVHSALSDVQQADSMSAQLFAAISAITNLDGITLWGAGTPTAGNIDLIKYTSGLWSARPSATVVNAYFNYLKNGTKPKRKIVL